MQIASVIGGFSLAQADMLRRAMGKKKKKEMDEMRALFIQGAKAQQLDTEKATHIFDLCYKFAEYGFNKSHSAAYALVSYQTAYLKANYPVEYMASLLSSVVNNADKTTLYTQECVAMGLTILPPSTLSSGFNFTVSDDTKIRYGLGAIKNVGEGAIESIISNRNETPESNLGEFLIKLDLKQVNKRVIESLIKAGALDHFGERGLLLTIYEQILERAQIAAREQQNGQVALFANTHNASGISISDLEDTEYIPISNQEKLRLEKEMVGTYISGHPLDDVREELQKMNASTKTISQADDKKKISLMGLLTGCRKLITKTKKEMLTGNLEDLFGSIPLVMFHNDHFEEIATIFQDGHIVRLEGRERLNNDEPSIMINHLTLIDNASLKKSLFIDIESLENQELLHQIKSITQTFKGDTPLYFKSGETTIKCHPKYWVSDTQLIQSQLEPLLGSGRVWLG
jgi:DNA polymerase-3 subunit alpha